MITSITHKGLRKFYEEGDAALLDNRYLIKGFEIDEDETLDVHKKYEDKMTEIAKNIVFEYAVLTENRKVLESYKAKIKIACLEFTINCIENSLQLFEMTERVEMLLMVDGLGIKIDQDGDLNKQVIKIIKKVTQITYSH